VTKMCGRYIAKWDLPAFSKHFETPTPLFAANYNIAPSSSVPIVFFNSGERQTAIVRWGLVPAWARSPETFNANLFNARAETVAEKPAFRNALKTRRCLIPTSGFYEWQRLENSKQPFFIYHSESDPFAFAGLWERWEGGLEFDGRILETCTIITTEANDLIKPIHDRMPVIVQQKDYDQWLDPDIKHIDGLEHLFKPFPQNLLSLYPVSRRVGHVGNNDAKLLNPVPGSTANSNTKEERELVPF
jgi:putative SOS response-associated peptidase YedK